MIKHRNDERGVILLTILIITGVLMLVGISLIGATASQYSRSTDSTYDANALLTAEAGVEQSLQQLNQADGFTGYSTAQQFFSSKDQGRATFTTTVANSATDANAKVVTSTGKIYRFYNASRAVSTRVVRVTVVGTSAPGYAVQSGVGGLILGGSAHIYNSQVYVNGNITLSGAAGIGSNTVPSNVFVSNQACPTGNTPGATYPQVCTGSQQPINLAYSTYIYGTVCATGQTSTGPNPSKNILPGNSGEGLKVGCTAPPAALPTYDKPAHLSRVTTSAAGTDNNYVCNSWPFDRTWPANLKLTGNVSVGGSCNVKLKGDTYITGNLDIGGAAHISVDDSVGATRAIVLVDGTITVNGSAVVSTNAAGTGILFISMKSSASCNPNCTNLSGNDLKTSSLLETVNVGGAANIPGMIFQAYWGKITIGGVGSIGSAIGQTIDMSGAGNVVFGTALSSGSHTWNISSYQQLYTKDL